MFHTKKAQDTKTELLMLFVLSVFIFIFLFFFLRSAFDTQKDDVTREACLSSVRAAGLTNPKVPGLLNLKGQSGHDIADLNCPIEEFTYTNQYFDNLDYDEDVYSKGIKKEIAMRMYECNYKMDRGRSDFVPNVEQGTSGKGNLNYCVICSTMDFTTVSVDDSTVSGLLKYLAVTPLNDDQKDPAGKLTFWEYLTEEEPPKEDEEGSAELYAEQDALPTDQKLAVVFVLSKYQDPKDMYVLMGLGAAGGFATGHITSKVTGVAAAGSSALGVSSAIFAPMKAFTVIGKGLTGVSKVATVGMVFMGALAGYKEYSVYRSRAEANLGEMPEDSDIVFPPNTGIMVIPFEPEIMGRICNYLGDVPDDEAFRRSTVIPDPGEEDVLDPTLPGEILKD